MAPPQPVAFMSYVHFDDQREKGRLTQFMTASANPIQHPICTRKEDSMPMHKPHLEFHRLDLDQGWATPEGYPSGIQQKILASDIDEKRKMGSRSRLLRFAPGVYTTAPFVHDHWEEVYLLSGDLTVGNDAKGQGGESFQAPTYACRPPGVYHGPFKSEGGCMLFEIHYYDESTQQ